MTTHPDRVSPGPGSKGAAVAYLRVSTQDQSVDAQRAAIEAWAEREGRSVASWHEDHGLSGSLPVDKRPGLLDALGALKGLQGGVLVVAKRDRLARDVMIAAIACGIAKRHGGSVVSADGAGNGDSPTDRLMAQILDAFAEFERALICARTRAGLAAIKARNGKYTRISPYGWRFEGDQMLEHAPEQLVRRWILGLREQGMSFQAIGDTLGTAGLRDGTTRWFAMTVKRICDYVPPSG